MPAVALLLVLALQQPDTAQLLERLESDDPAEADRASSALVERGEAAEAEVRRRLEAGPSLEVAARLRRVLEQIELGKGLNRVRPPVKKITIEAKDRPLPDVIDELQRRSGIEMDATNLGNHRPAVTLSVREVSFLEALDALCRVAGLNYSSQEMHFALQMELRGEMWDGPGARSAISLMRSHQPPSVHRVFLEHFKVSADQIVLTRSSQFGGNETRQGSLVMNLQWTPTLRPRNAWIQPESVVDDKGRNLLPPAPEVPERMARMMRMHRNPGGQIPIAYPEEDAKAIHVKGSVEAEYPADRVNLRVDKPEEWDGKAFSHLGRSYFLKGLAQDGPNARLIVEMERDPQDPRSGLEEFPVIRLILENEATARSHGRGGGGGQVLRFTLNFHAEAAVRAVEIETYGRIATESLKFELRDLPLPP